VNQLSRTVAAGILACSLLAAQSPTLSAVSPASFNFFSYSTVAQPLPPAGYQFALTFPNQTSGAQDELPACRTYTDLAYNHYTWNGPGQAASDWSGPVSGPLIRSYTMYDATSRSPSLGSWGGLAVDASWQGALGSTDGAQYNSFVQAVFFHDNICYEYGPEFGFYRLLITPGNTTEQNTVYFYYTMNGNCYNVGAYGSCRSREDGSSLVANTTSVALTIPAGTNSQGGTNWLWSAYLSTPTNWRIRVQDPYTLADAITPVNHSVESYFVSTAAAAYTYGLRGWISSTHVRQSAPGGLTDSMSNPIKLLTRAMYRILPVAVVAGSGSLMGMERASGWCENGGRTVTIGTNTAQQKVQGSYPGCSVTVYATGTANKATIYSDSSGTPLANPFAANSISGFWSFYAHNGTYDVQLSGGSPSFPAPVTLGARTLFDASESTIIGSYTLPSSVGTGCWYDNGLGVLNTVSCSVGGGANAVQYNSGGSFGGSSRFVWNNAANQLTVDGTPSTAAINVLEGNVSSTEGFSSTYAQYNGFRSTVGGAYLRGQKIEQAAASTTGGYAQFVPLSGVTYPTTLAGGSFGTNDMLLWAGATNGTASPNVTYGINTNGFFNGAAGLVTTNTPFNSVQAPSGGMYAKSFTALTYIQAGSNNGVPSATQNDSFHAGALFYDTGASCLKLYGGSGWACLGSGGGGGGGGSPGGASTNVQFNSSGAFGGSSNFTWNNGSQLLTVIAASAGSAGLAVGTGYIQSDKGFLATAGTGTAYNVFQAPGGGMYAKSFTALNYVQAGNSNGTPTLTTGDSFHAGALYFDTGTMTFQAYDGSTWNSLSGGTGTPGGANTNVQYNNSGAFGGSANFTFNSATRLLTVTTAAATAGIAVGTGYMQADAGFLATGGSCTAYNCIQAPGGGVAALAFVGTRYVQTGNGAVDPTAVSGDSFHAGALYYSTSSSCLKVHNGTSFSCVSGAGGTPGGSNTQVQFNNSGAFGGSANFIWNNGSQLLTVTAASAGSAGIAVGTGYIQADKGFLASTGCTAYNCFQTANGGLYGRSLTALTYLQTGNNSGVPSATTGDTFNAGAMFWDTAAAAEKVYNGSTWLTVSTSGSAVTSVNAMTGAITIAGTANQINVSAGGGTVTLSTPQSIATTSNVTFGTVTTNGVQQAVVTGTSIAFQTANFNFQVNGNGVVSAQQLNIAGSQVIDGSRNGTFAQITASSAATFNGGLSTGSGTNSQIYINSGNFYNRTVGGGVSCLGVSDGWTGINTVSKNVMICIGGSVYYADLHL
jgi:hypothetical protein